MGSGAAGPSGVQGQSPWPCLLRVEGFDAGLSHLKAVGGERDGVEVGHVGVVVGFLGVGQAALGVGTVDLARRVSLRRPARCNDRR